MLSIQALLSVVLHKAAENLKNRGVEVDPETRLMAVVGVVRAETKKAPGRSDLITHALARELARRGCEIDSRNIARQLLQPSPVLDLAQSETGEIATPRRQIAEAILELLRQPDMSDRFELCHLWESAGSANE